MSDTSELDAQEVTKTEVVDNKSKFDLEGALTEIVKLRQEAASYRVRAKNSEEAKVDVQAQLTQSLSATSELENKVQEYQTNLEKLEASQKTLTLKTLLAGRVVDADKAIKLIDASDYNTEGAFQVDKFLEANPFLVVKDPKINTPVNNAGITPQADMSKLVEDKDEHWIAAHWKELTSKSN